MGISLLYIPTTQQGPTSSDKGGSAKVEIFLLKNNKYSSRMSETTSGTVLEANQS